MLVKGDPPFSGPRSVAAVVGMVWLSSAMVSRSFSGPRGVAANVANVRISTRIRRLNFADIKFVNGFARIRKKGKIDIIREPIGLKCT